jgi:hypothetical protein
MSGYEGMIEDVRFAEDSPLDISEPLPSGDNDTQRPPTLLMLSARIAKKL